MVGMESAPTPTPPPPPAATSSSSALAPTLPPPPPPPPPAGVAASSSSVLSAAELTVSTDVEMSSSSNSPAEPANLTAATLATMTRTILSGPTHTDVGVSPQTIPSSPTLTPSSPLVTTTLPSGPPPPLPVISVSQDWSGLFAADEDQCMAAVGQLKNAVIGSSKKKKEFIDLGVLTRLGQLLHDPSTPTRAKVQVAFILGSLAKGIDSHVKAVMKPEMMNALLNTLASPEPRLVEASLLCLRTIFQHADAPHDLIFSDPKIVPHLMQLINTSTTNQISVVTIFAHACKTNDQQDELAHNRLIPTLYNLLLSPYVDVQVPALDCLAQLVYCNDVVARMVVGRTSDSDTEPDSCSSSSGGSGGGDDAGGVGEALLGQVVSLMDRNRKKEMQLAAARCLTYLFRCNVIDEDDKKVIYKALPCLVRMIKPEEAVENRIVAADTLAYLIENSANLQRIAAISNHLIFSMTTFLNPDWSALAESAGGVDKWYFQQQQQQGQGHDNSGDDDRMSVSFADGHFDMNDSVGGGGVPASSLYLAMELRRSAFRVFASLGANDEEIRKRLIETDHLMPCLVKTLNEPQHLRLQMSAIGCLHSLSRSVQLLRTTFQDHPVWAPLMAILKKPDQQDEHLIIASSTLCNLLLEFSPSKEAILQSGAIEMLCMLTRREEAALRLNGVWGLMNMAFQADQKIKVDIIDSLESDQIFHLLSGSDIDVVMKTLGLLRNLLSNKEHIDYIMDQYGKQIMQSVVLILESNHLPDVKEQALCLLGNIGDGETAKKYIMSNEDVLKKIMNYLLHHDHRLQIAAIVCVQNLILPDDEGTPERQDKLRSNGVYKILQQLLATTDAALFEKVKCTLQQFS